MIPRGSAVSWENVASERSTTRPGFDASRSATLHVTEAPVARSVTVNSVPNTRVGLAHVPAGAPYHVACPISLLRGAGTVVVGGGVVGGGDVGAGDMGAGATYLRGATVVVVVVADVVVVVVSRRSSPSTASTRSDPTAASTVETPWTSAAKATAMPVKAEGSTPGPGPGPWAAA